MAFTQPAAKDIPSCRRGPEGRTHTVQLCSILNNLKYQHCTHSSPSPSPSLSLLTVTSLSYDQVQPRHSTSTLHPPLLAFPALARRSLGALRARRIHARRSPRLRKHACIQHTHTLRYVTLRYVMFTFACTQTRTHAAKHRNPHTPGARSGSARHCNHGGCGLRAGMLRRWGCAAPMRVSAVLGQG
jgi:hypothetical protein